MQVQENTPTSFKRWYDANREELNKRRRQRYKKDKDYRDKQLANTRRWRKNRKKVAKPKAAPKTSFTIGEAARIAECSVESIRNYEEDGFIPVATNGRHHRRYTRKQAELIGEIASFRRNTHYKAKGFAKQLKKLLKRVSKQWGDNGA